MMKGLSDLVDSKVNMIRGNHRVEVNGDIRKFYYFNHCVCVVNDKKETFKLDACGYEGYSSTTRTLNDYRHWFEAAKNYKEVWD